MAEIRVTAGRYLRPMAEIIDPRFLPFTIDELCSHMPPQGASAADRPERWVNHFVASAARYRQFLAAYPERRGVPIGATRTAAQVEKDERFWTATTFMHLMRTEDAGASLEAILSDAYGPTPPAHTRAASWRDLLDGDLHMYLEVALPSPKEFQAELAARIDRHPVEYVRLAARLSGSDAVKANLEGRTNVDAVVVNPETGFGVLVEAKVLSDISHDVSFDPIRNQVARNLDAMLDANPTLAHPLTSRQPHRSFFLLVTPRLFVEHPTARLYGWLMNDYQNSPEALARDLAHRASALDGVSERIGWTSWERIDELVPGTCPWLTG